MSELERPNIAGWFAHKADEAGRRVVISRPHTCGCGREYTQYLLSARFCEIVERANAMNALLRDVPELYVPVYCPVCERKELGMRERPSSGWLIPVPRRITDRTRFAKNLAQLCAAWNKPVDEETSQVFWRALERAMTDEEFERGVLSAVREEKKWPTPSVIAQHGRAA